MKIRLPALGTVALAMGMAACGGSSSPSVTATTTTTSAPTTSTTTTIGHTVTSAPPGQPSAVPNEVGVKLDQAEGTLLADNLGYKVDGGGAFGVISPAGWTVCSQQPPAGATAAAVTLVVARSCS